MVVTLLALGLFVSPEEAATLLAREAAVLDARPSGLLRREFRRGHLPGAVSIDWKDYRDGWGRTGRLPRDLAALARRLGDLGVDGGRPVLVYGQGVRQEGSGTFGEEGRIAWMLSYLGHPAVHLLDGGWPAWVATGRAQESGPGRSVRRGVFVPRPRAELRAGRPEVEALSRGSAGPGLLIDVRSRHEWLGATPYLEARGGHIPAARHLPWQDLFDERGRVLPPRRIRDLLSQRLGVSPTGAPLILYCTGGVRSAMAWAALAHAGVAGARNYDGSFWEWAADRSLQVEGP